MSCRHSTNQKSFDQSLTTPDASGADVIETHGVISSRKLITVQHAISDSTILATGKVVGNKQPTVKDW